MRLLIDHLTRHRYSHSVSFGDHRLFLRPRDTHKLRVQDFALQSSPPARLRWIRDCHNNIVLVANFGLAEAELLELRCRMTIDVEEDNPFDFILDPGATAYPFRYDERDRAALAPYLDAQAVADSHHALDWLYTAIPSVNQHADIVQFLADINQAVHRDIAYARRDEEGVQAPNLTLELRLGSCRDMAWLFIAACRQLGLAARFVSGYLYDPPVDSAHGEDHLFNRAVGSMHAWAEVFLPGAGWKGFDPTNGLLANEYFLPSAVAHEPSGVDPIQGNYFSKQPASSQLEIELSITEANT